MQLILGDCIAEMAKMEASSIDLLLADPQYDLGRGMILS